MSMRSRWLILAGGSLLAALARARRSERTLLPRYDGSRARPTPGPRPAAPVANRDTAAILPCRRERERILLDLLPDHSTAADLDLSLLARLTSGYDPQTLRRLVSHFTTDADAEGRAPTMSDAAHALERLAGQEGHRPRLLEPDERQRAAHLVAGLVTIAWTCGLIDQDTTVSIFDDDPVWSLIEPSARMTTDGLTKPIGTFAALDTVLAGPIAVALLNEGREWELDETMLRAVVLASRIAATEHVGDRPSPSGFALSNGRGGLPAWGRGRPTASHRETGLDHDVRDLLEQRRQLVRERLHASAPQLRQLVALLVEEEIVDERTLAALFERQ